MMMRTSQERHFIPSLKDIQVAHYRIESLINRTPVMTCKTFDKMFSCDLFFKCENLQKVGAFKFRGATNAVLSLDDEEAINGVATHSSGNHAQALALAARNRGIPAHIVMPRNAPKVKVDAVKHYGAQITFCKPTLDARESTLEKVLDRTDAIFIHPYDDGRIISGQATAAIELLDDVNDLDIVMAPVGGGGLLSGTSLAVRYLSSDTKVIAAEPINADDAFRSFKSNRLIPSKDPDTIADGLKTSLSDLTFKIISENVDDIVTTSEDGIRRAMRLIWERMKIVVEPSASVPLAAILENKLDVKDKRVGIILSGRNVDLDRIAWN
jgi:threonine dehydratase